MQIFDYAIVREDLHLVVRENDRQKLTALPNAISCGTNARSRRAAVMSVGDVQEINGNELRINKCDILRAINHPRGVLHAVIGGEVDGGLVGGEALGEGIEFCRSAVSEKDGAGL